MGFGLTNMVQPKLQISPQEYVEIHFFSHSSSFAARYSNSTGRPAGPYVAKQA